MTTRRAPILRLLAGLTVWLACSAFGPYRPTGLGALSLGQADAVVATGMGVTALYANPANMAVGKRQTFDASVARDPQAGTSTGFIGGVDGTSSWGLSAGVGYAYDLNWGMESAKRANQDLRFGAAIGSDSDAGRLMLGVSGRYLTGQDLVRNVAFDGWGMDLGAAAVLGHFRAGVAIRNVVRVDNSETPRRVAGGVGWSNEHFLFDAEGAWATDALSGTAYRIGVAIQPGEEGLQIRTGYAFDQTVPQDATRHFVALGLSWRSPRYSIDLSGAMNVVRVGETIVGLTLGYTMPQDGDTQ